MKEIICLEISRHAIERYRERVGPLPAEPHAARLALFGELFAAQPKELNNLKKIKEKKTTIIQTQRCVFVASFGTIVTVITHEMLRRSHPAAEGAA